MARKHEHTETLYALNLRCKLCPKEERIEGTISHPLYVVFREQGWHCSTLNGHAHLCADCHQRVTG